MSLKDFYLRFLNRIEHRLSGKNWLWQLVVFSVLLSLFLAFPPYTLLIDHYRENGVKLDAWVFIENQAQDLFHPKDMEYDVRRENMIFRWTLPLLSLLTRHNVVLIVLIQSLLGVWFLKRIAAYLFELTGDKISTALFTIALANTFTVVWIFTDVHGYGDGLAYFFLLATLFSRNPILIFIYLQTAFFTDERAVVAGGYLLLWWMVNRAFAKSDFTISGLFKSLYSRESLTVWVAWVAYFATRYYVRVHYFPDHNYSTLGTPVLFASAHRNGLGSSLFGTFEGLWLLLAGAALMLLLLRKYLLFSALSFGFFILVLTGIYVHDIDRALAYGFPFLLISVFILVKTNSIENLRMIFFFSMVICVFHLQVFYMGYNKILWLEPLPVKVLMYVDQLLGWKYFY